MFGDLAQPLDDGLAALQADDGVLNHAERFIQFRPLGCLRPLGQLDLLGPRNDLAGAGEDFERRLVGGFPGPLAEFHQQLDERLAKVVAMFAQKRVFLVILHELVDVIEQLVRGFGPVADALADLGDLLAELVTRQVLARLGILDQLSIELGRIPEETAVVLLVGLPRQPFLVLGKSGPNEIAAHAQSTKGKDDNGEDHPLRQRAARRVDRLVVVLLLVSVLVLVFIAATRARPGFGFALRLFFEFGLLLPVAADGGRVPCVMALFLRRLARGSARWLPAFLAGSVESRSFVS